jgi:hypothetical protein
MIAVLGFDLYSLGFVTSRSVIVAKTVSEKLAGAGNTVAGVAKSVGSKIAEGAENAVDFVKETTGLGTPEGKNVGVGGIRTHMSVVASCGKTIGIVDSVETNSIKLTRKDSPDDQHHFIPLNWISRVDSHVHLNRNSKEAIEGWSLSDSCNSSDSCGCDA